MKIKAFTAALLILILGAVTVNTIVLPRRIDRIIESVEAVTPTQDNSISDMKKAYDGFLDAEGYFSLTLNHNDLCEVGSLFVEAISYLSVENFEEASVAKSRLINALTHLRRLSEINIGSVF